MHLICSCFWHFLGVLIKKYFMQIEVFLSFFSLFFSTMYLVLMYVCVFALIDFEPFITVTLLCLLTKISWSFSYFGNLKINRTTCTCIYTFEKKNCYLLLIVHGYRFKRNAELCKTALGKHFMLQFPYAPAPEWSKIKI